MSEQRTDRAGVVVRRLVAEDWEQARAARLAALTEAPYAFSSTLAREQAFDEAVWRSRAGSGRTFGAFDGGVIVGLVTGLPADEVPPSDPPGDGESSDSPGDGEGSDSPGDGESSDSPGDGEGSEPRGDQAGRRTSDWHLVGMWVAPACRGQGVADALVATACDVARVSGASAVTLWVTEVNDRARAFYRRLGFAATGARMLVRPDEPDHWEEELRLDLG